MTNPELSTYLKYFGVLLAVIGIIIGGMFYLKPLTPGYGVTQSALEVHYLTNYTEWTHYATTAKGICAYEVFPEDNRTITSVGFKVVDPTGAYAVGSADAYDDGVQDPANFLLYTSPAFTPNKWGQWNCTIYVLQSDADESTTSSYFNVSYYAAEPACEWKADCTMTTSTTVNTNVSHRNLVIPAGKTLTVGIAPFTAVIQEDLNVSGILDGSGNAKTIYLKAQQIYNPGSILFYGSGVGCNTGGNNGGTLYLLAALFNNTGNVFGYGGPGGAGCAKGCTCYVGHTDFDLEGGAGGTGGTLNTSYGGDKLGKFINEGTINLDGGTGGDGAYGCVSGSSHMGDGGAGGAAGVMQIDGVIVKIGSTSLKGGNGGWGGPTGDSDCADNICFNHPVFGTGGTAGSGGANKYYIRDNFTATLAITAAAGTAGSGWSAGTCLAGSSGSTGSHTIYWNSSSGSLTGTANFTPSYVNGSTTQAYVNRTAPSAPTITAPAASTNYVIPNNNITVTWTAVSGLTYELFFVDNAGKKVFVTPNKGMDFQVNFPSYTTGSYANIGTHWLSNGTITFSLIAYNATNKMFSAATSRAFNITYSNTTNNTWTSPAGPSMSTNSIAFYCNYTNSSTYGGTGGTEIYAATVLVDIDGGTYTYNATYIPALGYYLYNMTNNVLQGGNHSWRCRESRTDWMPITTGWTNFNITGFSVNLPPGQTSFRFSCPFSTVYNVTPAGQKAKVGIFRIQSYNTTALKNYTIKLNSTPVTGVTMYVVNTTSNRSAAITLTTTAQTILNLINSTNTTAYIWMWIDCVGAPISTSGTFYQFEFNEST